MVTAPKLKVKTMNEHLITNRLTYIVNILCHYKVFLNDILVFTFAKFVMRINFDYFCRIGLQNVLYYSSKGTLRFYVSFNII